MTPDTALGPIEESKTIEPPSTAGMTTKVVKGSLWTLVGSVIPLAVTFVSTPFIIRFLGSESYGVLLLVGLIPTYFSFADFGMGIASTKFASEAYGQGKDQRERDVVWTATAISTVSSMIIAVPMFLFSMPIVTWFDVPENLRWQSSIGLKITSVAFVIGVLASVLNSPMLARLRMDLNTVTQAAPKVLLAAVTPFILYFGGGIVEAVSWSFIVGVVAFAGVFYFSYRLLPVLSRPRFDRDLLTPLLTFGGGIVAASLAGILLVNFEKLALSKLTSVTSLAYYSVAYTLANIAMMFSAAMTQSLVPAFAQLLVPHKKGELDSLFGSTIRITIVGLLPLVVFLWIAAGPFLRLWLGEEFARESTLPFHVLLIGVAFNMLAFIQHSLITSMGRTTLIAVLYWIELALYAVISVGLIYWLGIVGAALAWTIRVAVDAIIFIVLGQKIMGMSFKFRDQARPLLLPVLALLPVIVIGLLNLDYQILLLILVTPMSFGVYLLLIWKGYLHATERGWISARFSRILGARS